MKAVFAAIAALSLGACANEGPTAEELQAQLERGATGQGTLTPEIDRAGDPYVRPRDSETIPRP